MKPRLCDFERNSTLNKKKLTDDNFLSTVYCKLDLFAAGKLSRNNIYIRNINQTFYIPCRAVQNVIKICNKIILLKRNI